MKACALCYRLYPDEAAFCAIDGGPLTGIDDTPPQPAGDDRFLGKTLSGRYQMRRIVADGGMGRVYEAYDAVSDRRVAIKVLHPEVARDAVAVERFRREFEISKDLPHDHIVDVLGFEPIAAAQQYIMVMEFLDGEELRATLRRERTIPPPRLLRMLSQIAIALDEAHRRQFVHRDLKPDNVFLCGGHDGDVVKILDFGSARINANRQASKLTSIGTTIGSPFYMSPEQAQGAEKLDGRADVFAVGAIVFECLTGTVPFTGPNGPGILLAILTKSPPPVSTKASPAMRLPATLDDVVDDALAKKPEMRTRSIGAFADAFGRAFGLAGDHVEWSKTPTLQLGVMIDRARAAGVAGAEAFADPFAPGAGSRAAPSTLEDALDPFAGGGAARGASTAGDVPPGADVAMPGGMVAAAPAPPHEHAARAMDDAFAAAGGDGAVSGPRLSAGMIAVIVAVIAGLVAIVVVLAR